MIATFRIERSARDRKTESIFDEFRLGA